jgi:DNA-binding Xre family transcriptional regulator
MRTLSFVTFYCNNEGKSRAFKGSDSRMIKFDRLWQTMKARGVTQYDLYTHHNVNRAQLNRLRHNQNVEVNTIDKLCNILNCRVEEIMEHIPDNNQS